MDCSNLITKYTSAFEKYSKVMEVDGNCLLITPFLNNDGTSIVIQANQNKDEVKLHDNGDTLQSLFISGVKVFDVPHREELFIDICRAYNIEFDGWVIQKIVNPEHIGDAIIDLVNALKSINDLAYLHSPTKSDIFKFTVKMFFKEKKLNVSPDYKIIGKTTTHKVDFYYEQSDNMYYINLISGSNLRYKIIRAGFTYYDVLATTKGANANWITLINPEDDWTKSEVNLLSNFSKTISWAHKEQLTNILI